MATKANTTRRAFLSAAPAAIAAVALGSCAIAPALAAAPAVTNGAALLPLIPTETIAIEATPIARAAVEDLWRRAHRLARELSEALAEIEALPRGLGGLGDDVVAVIYPKGAPVSVSFNARSYYQAAWERALTLG